MNAAIGLAIGAIAGVAGYQALSRVAASAKDEATARLLRAMAVVELFLMPLLGVLIGAFVLS